MTSFYHYAWRGKDFYNGATNYKEHITRRHGSLQLPFPADDGNNDDKKADEAITLLKALLLFRKTGLQFRGMSKSGTVTTYIHRKWPAEFSFLL